MWWWSWGMSSYGLIRLCSELACIIPCVKVTSRKVRKMRLPRICGVLQRELVSPRYVEGICRAGTWPVSSPLGTSFKGGEHAHICRSTCHQPQHSSGGWSGAASPRFMFTVAEITQTTWPSFYLWSLERAPDVKCPFPVCDLI